jgi:signal transduction histidine kinase/ligand-binding sensor domain-containing protein/DNA-binding response OmpR family regulator
MGTLNGLSRYDGSSFVNFHPESNTTGNRISLTSNHARKIGEDRNGFLWIETSGEYLNCYNPKTESFVDFTGCGAYKETYSRMMTAANGDIWLWHRRNGCRKVVYKDKKFSSVAFGKAEGNLPCDSVNYVFQDEEGSIWIGTTKGVSLVTGEGTTISIDMPNAYEAQSYEGNVFFLSTNGTIRVREKYKSIQTVAQLSKTGVTIYGSLRLQNDWVIFTSAGGYVFDMGTHQIRRKAELDIKNGIVTTDNKGDYWVYNHTGKVWYVNSQSRAIKTFELSSGSKLNYVDMERYYVVQDSRGIIWIATYGNGLFAYDTRTEELQHFVFQINGFSHISSNYLQYVMEDRTGNIWVSAEYAGVTRLSILNEGVKRIYPENTSLSDRSNTVRMIAKRANGDIYIGNRNGGVYAYDAQLNHLKAERHFHSSIYAIAEDSEGKLWVGSRGDGLSIDGKWYVNKPGESSSLSNNNIFTLYRDKKQRIWIGTYGGGLDLAVKGRNGAYSFRHFINGSISQRQIRAIIQDRNGWMWIGNTAGVYVFYPDSLIADPNNYHTYNYNNGSLPGNEIKTLYQDSKGRIWIGTSGGGFCSCLPDNNYTNLKFHHYDMSNGLINDMVQAIIEDRQGELWISTEYGISRFNPERETFANFFFSSHPLGNVYSDNSACITEDGKLLFGSNHGLVVVDPTDLTLNHSENTPSPIAFTSLQVNGIPMHPGDNDSPLKSALMYTDKIKLKHFQNSFVIDFTTFDYSGTNSKTYTYRLDNYDREWSNPSTLSFASYKNLPSGTYNLHVKVYDTTGTSDAREAVMQIVITPPFWKTGWALFIYAVILIIILYITYRLALKFNTLRNKIEVEKQLADYKLVFFTNISHEFRTPLTLIQGAMEKIQASKKATSKDLAVPLRVMEKSTQRMLRLINQLLEFRKMQNNKLTLSLESIDVISFLREIVLSFQDIAESKNMDFHFEPSVDSYNLFIDKDNLDKVVYNLLSNAFKYTPCNGKVQLSVAVNEAEKKLVITVSDTGVGIAKNKQGELFKRFMHSNISANSTGIGLHLTHELVNVHKGTITYNENPGGGSIFTVTLSTDKGIYDENDFKPTHIELQEEGNKEAAETPQTEPEDIVIPKPSTTYKVLIIEDDDDVREFLKAEFTPYFEVESEADGTSGFKHARREDIDLIVCDVLMPGMTGFEVTRKLKDDFDTSHIPIILLTALSTADSRLKGINSGADVYITKPFSPKLLLAQAIKLLEQRAKLRRKFSEDPNMALQTVCTTVKDKQFSDRLQIIVEKELSNSAFSMDDIATMMKLGRTTFYRKVRGVTGYTPNEYMRIMRMKKAAELLAEGNLTVAEVSYQVGIEDQFYFSKCFKKHFGVAPSVYLRGTKPNGEDNAD